jgi:hypothetical protein
MTAGSCCAELREGALQTALQEDNTVRPARRAGIATVYSTPPVGYPVSMLRIDPRWVSATKGTTFGAGLVVRVIVSTT